MIEDIKEDLIAHAKECYPRECCGVVVVFKGRNRYVKCRNISEYISDFEMHPEDFIAAEELGEIVAFCHSHPNGRAEPSLADKTSIEIHRLPWVILGYPTCDINIFEPCGYKAPLVGRKFVHGVHDCFALARDYYKDKFNIDIPDIPHEDRFWEKGQDIMTFDNFEKAGFIRVPLQELKEHDSIILQNSSDVCNHVAIYLGNNIILHQCINRLSSNDIYGGMWVKNSRYALRHKSMV